MLLHEQDERDLNSDEGPFLKGTQKRGGTKVQDEHSPEPRVHLRLWGERDVPAAVHSVPGIADGPWAASMQGWPSVSGRQHGRDLHTPDPLARSLSNIWREQRGTLPSVGGGG